MPEYNTSLRKYCLQISYRCVESTIFSVRIWFIGVCISPIYLNRKNKKFTISRYIAMKQHNHLLYKSFS